MVPKLLNDEQYIVEKQGVFGTEIVWEANETEQHEDDEDGTPGQQEDQRQE